MSVSNVDKPERKVTGNGYYGYLANKRKTVFAALDKNPLLTPATLATILEIPFKDYSKEKKYLKKLKYEWKHHHLSERGSIRSLPDDVHNVFYKGFLPVDLVKKIRGDIVEVLVKAQAKWCFGYPYTMVGNGWTVTENNNHALLYKHSSGRIRLFDSGTVEIYVRKPANKGKAMQLFSYALISTKLIDSIQVLDGFQKNLLTRMHATFEVGQRVPYCKVDAFKDSHGFGFVSGDRTHPTSYEFMFEYNSEVVAARDIFAQVGDLLKGLGGPLEAKRLFDDYSR